MVMPFAHHHLMRTPREGTSVHCGGLSCVVQCVACQWETTSVADTHTPLLSSPPLEEAAQPPLDTSPVYRLLLGTPSPRAPPVA